MSKFAEVELPDGTVVYFETIGDGEGNSFDAFGRDEGFKQLEEMAKAASQLRETFLQRLTPDSTTLELSVGLSAQVGWFFAKSEVEAVISLALTWEKSDSGSPS